MNAIKLSERQNNKGSVCPFCRDELNSQGLECEECATILHEECWIESKRCSTLACKGFPKSLQRVTKLTKPTLAIHKGPRGLLQRIPEFISVTLFLIGSMAMLVALLLWAMLLSPNEEYLIPYALIFSALTISCMAPALLKAHYGV